MIDINAQQQRIKSKTSMYIIVITLLFGLFSIGYLFLEKRNALEKSLEDNARIAGEFFYAQVRKNTQLLANVSDRMMRDEVLIKVFVAQDREALVRESERYFDWLRLLNADISNMHYYLPDTVSFLRMHKREAYGDDLSCITPIVTATNKTLQRHEGYEAGLYGFYLRVVSPLFYERRHIGALGLGLNLSAIISELQQVNRGIYLIAMEHQDPALEKLSQFHNMQDFSIYQSPKRTYIAKKRSDLERFAPLLSDAAKSTSEVITLQNRRYLVSYAMKINNFEEQTIATIVSIHDVSDIYRKFNADLVRSVILNILMIVLVLLALEHGFKLYGTQTQQLYREYAQTSMRLQSLSSKLNPHFLVNALNVISELMYSNVAKAEENIVRLSQLLRNYLGAKESLTLRDELDYTLDYCYLQNTRFNDLHKVRIKVNDEQLYNVVIPKFSIQLLVENAFKHALQLKTPMIIKIHVYRRGDKVVLSVSNTGKKVERITFGFGLSNLQTRIEESCNGSMRYAHKCGVTNFTLYLKEPCEFFGY
ncbi:MAG: histidine kinase [Campylobacterales bacterium]|nr:histidine kinase [Campylobacterales bacterium]